MAVRRRANGRAEVKITKTIRDAEQHLTVNRMWRYTFLAVLAETSNVSRSAEAANVSASRAYKVRREDADFRRQWHEALSEGYDHLEMEVLRRLREGDHTMAEGGKFDFANALRILSAHRVTIGVQRARDNDADEAMVYAAIDAKIDALRRSRQAQIEYLRTDAHEADSHEMGNVGEG